MCQGQNLHHWLLNKFHPHFLTAACLIQCTYTLRCLPPLIIVVIPKHLNVCILQRVFHLRHSFVHNCHYGRAAFKRQKVSHKSTVKVGNILQSLKVKDAIYIVPDISVKCKSESIHWKKQFARVVFWKVHIFACVPRRCVWQTTHFLRQLNCAVEPNGGDYGRCWVSPRSSKKPPRPMVRRREISLEIFSDIFIFASNSKHKTSQELRMLSRSLSVY